METFATVSWKQRKFSFLTSLAFHKKPSVVTASQNSQAKEDSMRFLFRAQVVQLQPSRLGQRFITSALKGTVALPQTLLFSIVPRRLWGYQHMHFSTLWRVALAVIKCAPKAWKTHDTPFASMAKPWGLTITLFLNKVLKLVPLLLIVFPPLFVSSQHLAGLGCIGRWAEY